MAVMVVIAVMPAMPLAAQGADWPAYGRDLAGTRYLPSSVITPANVMTLQPAWTYRTGETGESFKTDKPASFEATPIVVDGIMYIGTPLGRVIALDAVTGAARWVYDPRIARDIEYGDFANRGVSTWLDSAAGAAPIWLQIALVATVTAVIGMMRFVALRWIFRPEVPAEA